MVVAVAGVFAGASHLEAGNDYAAALAIDSSENVYVTGGSEGAGTALDYATIKYNSLGALQWKARFNGPVSANDRANATTTDASGNVYVTGSSVGSNSALDYVTIKYNASGAPQWLTRYNGVGNGDDVAVAIAVDGSGNVYVTGSSLGGSGGLDFATIKYNSNGATQWVQRWSGFGQGNSVPTAIGLDSTGHVYVTGSALRLGAGLEFMTLKLNANGTLAWWTTYNGTGNGDDMANALVVDASANVYVTGSSLGGTGGLDFATIKYNSNGARQWVHRFAGFGQGNNVPRAIGLDSATNVIVTGNSAHGSAGLDFLTLKLKATGTLIWSNAYNGTGSGDDIAYALAVDGSDNIVVTGSSLGAGGTALDYATVKYNANGTQRWVARYNGPGGGDDSAVAVKINHALGNVYVTGSSLGAGTGPDYATIKYNSNGVQQWVSRLNGP